METEAPVIDQQVYFALFAIFFEMPMSDSYSQDCKHLENNSTFSSYSLMLSTLNMHTDNLHIKAKVVIKQEYFSSFLLILESLLA